MAGVTGIEPATFGVTGRRSNQAELHPHWMRNVVIEDVRQRYNRFFLVHVRCNLLAGCYKSNT